MSSPFSKPKIKIDVKSGSDQSKNQLKSAMIEADEVCSIVSEGQPKTYSNDRCVYYSGFNDEPGQENIQHDSCVVVKEGSTLDEKSGDDTCII